LRPRSIIWQMMNTRCIIQVKVPTEMEVNLRFKTAGGQETGAVPRFDLSERATPKAMIKRPTVATMYLLIKSFMIIYFISLQIWLKFPNFAI